MNGSHVGYSAFNGPLHVGIAACRVGHIEEFELALSRADQVQGPNENNCIKDAAQDLREGVGRGQRRQVREKERGGEADFFSGPSSPLGADAARPPVWI